MLGRVIAWSLRNVFLVLMTTVFIIGGGIVAMLKMPLDALPDLSDVQVIVYTEYPGQAPFSAALIRRRTCASIARLCFKGADDHWRTNDAAHDS